MGQQTSKIAYDVMIQSIETGGMKLVDFESKAKSLKLGFIKKYCKIKRENADLRTKIYKTGDLNYYFKFNRIPSNNGNKFYEKTLHYWNELKKIRIPTGEIIHNQTIWENRYITI